MLRDCHTTPETLLRLRALWNESSNIRIEEAFESDVLVPLVEALPQQSFQRSESKDPLHPHSYFKSVLDQHWDPFQPFTTLWAWLNGEGLDWVESLTGQSLTPPSPKSASIELYSQGCFHSQFMHLESPHAIGFVMGLSSSTWAEHHGGHLLFYDRSHHPFLRRAPQYNTLDLFEVCNNDSHREIPLLALDIQRYTVSGWLNVQPS